MTLSCSGWPLAVSPLAQSRPDTRSFRPDALGIVLGLALGAQGLELLSTLWAPQVIPTSRRRSGSSTPCSGSAPPPATWFLGRRVGPLRRGMGAGLSLLALWIDPGARLWTDIAAAELLAVLLAAAFIADALALAPDSVVRADVVRTRVAGTSSTARWCRCS